MRKGYHNGSLFYFDRIQFYSDLLLVDAIIFAL